MRTLSLIAVLTAAALTATTAWAQTSQTTQPDQTGASASSSTAPSTVPSASEQNVLTIDNSLLQLDQTLGSEEQSEFDTDQQLLAPAPALVPTPPQIPIGSDVGCPKGSIGC